MFLKRNTGFYNFLVLNFLVRTLSLSQWKFVLRREREWLHVATRNSVCYIYLKCLWCLISLSSALAICDSPTLSYIFFHLAVLFSIFQPLLLQLLVLSSEVANLLLHFLSSACSFKNFACRIWSWEASLLYLDHNSWLSANLPSFSPWNFVCNFCVFSFSFLSTCGAEVTVVASCFSFFSEVLQFPYIFVFLAYSMIHLQALSPKPVLDFCLMLYLKEITGRFKFFYMLQKVWFFFHLNIKMFDSTE